MFTVSIKIVTLRVLKFPFQKHFDFIIDNTWLVDLIRAISLIPNINYGVN